MLCHLVSARTPFAQPCCRPGNLHLYLQYGYLQPEDPPQLIGVDRHDFVPKGAIWKSNNAFVEPIAPFSGEATRHPLLQT
jgi:hypothetical protein